MPTSPPHQRRRRNNTPPSTNPNSAILEALQTLNLESCAISREVNIKFKQLSSIYHPDKHDPSKTGMTNAEVQNFFQRMKNAQELLTDYLQTNQPPVAQ